MAGDVIEGQGLQWLEDIWQLPEFTAAPYAKRQKMLDAVLSEAYADVAGAPDYSPQGYKQFGEVADAARKKLEQTETVGEKVGAAGRTVGHFIGGLAKDVGTAGLATFGAPWTEGKVGSAMETGFELGARKRIDWVDNSLSRMAGAQDKARTALDGLRKEIDEGAFPARDPNEFNAWLSERSAKISEGQDLAWAERTPEDLARYSLAADPDARALVTEYITTRRPGAWSELQSQVLKSPRRREIERESLDVATKSPGAQWMNKTFGEGAGEHLVSAADPVTVASYIMPFARVLRGAAAAETAATAAGKASTLGGRALGAAKGMAKGLPEQAALGAEMTVANDPNAPAGEIAKGSGEMMMAGTALGGLGFAGREAARPVGRALARALPRMPVNNPPEQAPVETPPVEPPRTEAPTEAPPVETEPPPGPQPGGTEPPPVETEPPPGPKPGGTEPKPVETEPPTGPKPGGTEPRPAETEPPTEPQPGGTEPPPEPKPAETEPPREELPPAETLERAGLPPEVVRPLHEAQDARSVTDPESARTLAEQFSLMLRGRKPAVLFDGLAPEQLPEGFKPKEGSPLRVLPTESGSLVYDSGQVSDADAVAAVKTGKLGGVLGYGIDDKPPGADRAVVLRTHDGHELVSVAVDDATEARVTEALDAMREPAEGDTLDVEPLDMVLADRHARRRAEVGDVRERGEAAKPPEPPEPEPPAAGRSVGGLERGTVLKVKMKDGTTWEAPLEYSGDLPWIQPPGGREAMALAEWSNDWEMIDSFQVAPEATRGVAPDVAERKFGEITYSQPKTREEYAEVLWKLAKEMRDQDTPEFDLERSRRKSQLSAQFEKVADEIELSKAKRRYMQANARAYAAGKPLPSPHDYMEGPMEARFQEPPKPTDFDPDPTVRRSRQPKPAIAYEPEETVRRSLEMAESELRKKGVRPQRREQLQRIIDKRRLQLRKGQYREAVEAEEEARAGESEAERKAGEKMRAEHAEAAEKARRSAIARKGAGIPDHPTGGRDILNDIEDNGGIYLPPPEHREGGDQDAMAEVAKVLPPRYLSIFNRSPEAQRADQMAQELHGRGRLKDGYAETLKDAILEAYQGRVNLRNQLAEQHQAARGEEKQVEAFAREVVDPPKARQKGRQTVQAGELSVGDKLVAGGEDFRVTALDPDTGRLTMEDGAKFGTQRVAPEEVLWVEGTPEAKVSTALEGWDLGEEVGSGKAEVGSGEAVETGPKTVTVWKAQRKVGDVKEGPKLGEFYTSSEQTANRLADLTGDVTKHELTLENPLVIPPGESHEYYDSADLNAFLKSKGVKFEFPEAEMEEVWRHIDSGGKEFTKAVRKAGYDSVQFPEYLGAVDQTTTLVLPEAKGRKGGAAPPEARPGLELETQTPEDVMAERMAAEERVKAEAQRDEIERRRQAKLTGDSSEVGQGTLFEEDKDLFSGPSAEGSGGGGVVGSIARGAMPAGPAPAIAPGGRMPAGPAPAGPAPAPAPRGGKPMGLTEIRKYLLDKVGLPAVGVGRFRQRAYGIYKQKPEVIRMKAINDMPTLAHEIGHHIHRLLDPSLPAHKPSDFGKRYDRELLPLGAPTSRPSYTIAQRRMEGVAEFTKHWLIEPSHAMAMAPRFAQHFQATLEANNPRVMAGLTRGREMIDQYVNQPAWTKLKSHLVFDQPKERRTIGEFLRGGYARWFNTTQPITDVTKAAMAADPRLAPEARRVQRWVENHRGGWQSKAHSDVMLDQTDLHGTVVGPALKTILKDLKPEQMEDFSTYIAVARAMELERQGRKSGFDFAGAPGWRADMARWAPMFEQARQGMLKWQDNAVKLLLDSGVISPKDYVKMKLRNQEFVPFYRLYEKATGVSLGPRTGGKGMVNNGSGLRQLKGSDRAILDPLESAVKNAFFFRKLAEQNNVGVDFFDLVNQLQGGGKYADRIAKRRAPTKVPHQKVVDTLIDAGVIASEADLPGGTDLAFEMWKSIKQPEHKIGEVTVRRNGNTEHYQVRDPMLLQALRVSDTDTVAVARALGPTLGKALTVPTRTLRWGATGHPVFAAMNFARDQMSAAVYSKTGYKPFWDGVRGALHVAKKDPIYREWVRSGGKFAGQVTHDEGMRSILADALPKHAGGRRMMAALASGRSWKRGIGLASEMLEEATRVQEFARARQQGMSPMDAANLSKEVTLNFARAGEVGRFLNQIQAFFNAGLQDMDKVAREHIDPKTRAQTIARGLTYITVPSVLAWALGKDDPHIQALPEWRKNFFWNVSMHGIAGALGRRGFVLSIPKPFLMGALYGTSVERALDAATGRDPNGARKALKNIGANTMFRGDLVSAMSALQPLIEAGANHDFFTGGQVVPDRMKGLPKEMQFGTQTSETARGIGKMTGQSPMIIDHLLQGYLGSAGRLGTMGTDWAMTKLGMAEGSTPPTKDTFEYPLARSFAAGPYERSEDVNRFYKALSGAQGLVDAWRKQAPQLTTDEQAKWWQKNGQRVAFYQQVIDTSTGLTRLGAVNKAAKQLSDINKAMRTVRSHRELSGDVKRERLIDLTEQYNAVAKGAFRRLFHPADVKGAY